MGTNYYAADTPCPNACEHCAKQDEWHIGKSLSMFEAHDDSPWGPIGSWQDWKRAITEHGLTVRDEYGVEHDPIEFIRSVEAVPVATRRRQYEWVRRHGYSTDYDYLDGDEFSFHRGEFT